MLETDYLVIGAGASGRAFTDELLSRGEADVILVDRRDRPGGHWNGAYPFVRLHQPSAFYGVNSRRLGEDAIERSGTNARLYETASAPEICDYFQRVLDERFLPSGRVRFLAMSDYVEDPLGTHRLVSRLSGAVTEIRPRRRVVDATYLEAPVPGNRAPAYQVDADATVIPINGLVSLASPGSGFSVIGAGKTAIDACLWLLDNGVEPGDIRWIRPRKAWLLSREFQQPLDLVTTMLEGLSLALEAAASAASVDDLFARLEACDYMRRIDPTRAPSMYRCATVSQGELARLRTIESVVRLGRVTSVGAQRIELADGSVATDARQVHVDCSSPGIRVAPPRTVFGNGRITIQQVRKCSPTFNAAVTAYVESSRDDDVERNRLCPSTPYPNAPADWITTTLSSQRTQNSWFADADLGAWLDGSRLNISRALRDHTDDPKYRPALTRYVANIQTSVDNLSRLAGRDD